MKLNEYKDLFYRGDIVHLNHGGLSPISQPVHEEIKYWSQRFFEEGYHSDADYKKRMEWSRSQVAHLIDCDSDEVAFFQSCAWGISQFAFGINLKEGDEVLIFDQEYSSNLYPWQAACQKNKAQLVITHSGPNLSTDVNLLISKITSRTKVISVSWVQYQTGAMIDLEILSVICKEKNILLFVDATQALGIHTLSFKNLSLDGLACGSHKWLNAPVGVGFLAIRKDLALAMKPIGYGALTYGECDDPSELECKPKMNASKFEPGAKQVLEINGLGQAIEIINSVGSENLKMEAFRFAQKMREQILSLDFVIHSPHKNLNDSQFICFSDKKIDRKILQKSIFDEGIRLPLRGAGIRLTPHALNVDADIDFFIDVLKKFKARN
jgi:cysteine desulfurase / selenocysteine lyase